MHRGLDGWQLRKGLLAELLSSHRKLSASHWPRSLQARKAEKAGRRVIHSELKVTQKGNCRVSQDGAVQGNPPRAGPVAGAVREHAGHTQAPPPPGSWLAWYFCPLPATLLGPLDSRKHFRCEDRTHILLDAGAREGGGKAGRPRAPPALEPALELPASAQSSLQATRRKRTRAPSCSNDSLSFCLFVFSFLLFFFSF